MEARPMTSAMSDERDAALSSWNGPPRTRERNTDVLAIGPFGLEFAESLMALWAGSVAKPQDVANLPHGVVPRPAVSRYRTNVSRDCSGSWRPLAWDPISKALGGMR